ncbi:hypothetical protein ABZ412_03000 [Nocardia sp. NPDC005746]|uniref:hypothetical protein n=1 Tax=Nocardia sp. NPDC005746 TaxID=3157062 RepID=UPI0033E98E0B
MVVPKDLKAAWDVPQDWSVDLSTTRYGTDADHIPAAGFAQEGIDYCPNNVRTTMFLSTSDLSAATAPAGCATTFSVFTYAVSAGSASGSLVLVIVADTGVDRSVSPDPARGIFATFRLL